MVSRLLTMSLIPSGLMVVVMLAAVVIGHEADQPELKLVNVVFRHGDRAPDGTESYPNDPYRNYSFYPMGRGGLTNGGKRRAYRLGQELKSRYGNFLGSVYEPWAIQGRSSDYDRTKMSLQLVLAALYPPAPIQKWSDDLPWQPIPAAYKRLSEDLLFEPELCPKYIAELDRVRADPDVLAKVSKYNSLMRYLGTHTGRPFKTTWEMYDLYHTLTAQAAVNLTLPEWSAELYSNGELWDGASLEYEVVSYNDVLKRLNGGMFVRKISEDLTAYRSGTIPAGRRMYLYSGHETNIGALLVALGIFEPHVPAYSSAIMIELWQLKDKYFVKILHYIGIPAEVVVKKLPGCAELCPLDTFLELTSSVSPSDSDLICVKSGRRTSTEVTPSSLLEALRNRVAAL